MSLDPTSLLTPGGREFLHIIAGPVGDEIATDYETVLRSIGVIPTGAATSSVVPYVTSTDYLEPATEASTVGRRVDNTKLLNLNGYLNSLQAPKPGAFDATQIARGQTVFSTTAAAGGGLHRMSPTRSEQICAHQHRSDRAHVSGLQSRRSSSPATRRSRRSKSRLAGRVRSTTIDSWW